MGLHQPEKFVELKQWVKNPAIQNHSVFRAQKGEANA
jgi:hypothetical protein